MTKMFSKVKGNTYIKNGQSILETIPNGSLLRLEREPANGYDKNAIKIFYGDSHIGFIDGEAARSLAPRMDTGEQFRCIAEQITGGGTYNYGCNISLEEIENVPAPKDDGPSFEDTSDSIDDLLGI